jgi:hypothetical protein
MFNHIVYISNQILLAVKKDGVTWETMERAGKLLWRLFNVIQAYNAKQRDVTLQSILDIVWEFKSIFGGI